MMTVATLIEKLQKMPQDALVQIWLPGTYIDPREVFSRGEGVLIEGNVANGEPP